MSWGWLKQGAMLGALFIPLLMALGSGSLNGFMPLYGKEQSISPSQIGIIIAIYYASSSVLRAPFGKLTDRYGPRHMIVAGSLIFIAGMALFSLAHSFLTMSLVAVLFGLGFGLGFPAGLVAAANHAPPHMRGLAMSMCTATFQVGVALGTMLMGFVANARGFETMFLVAGAIMLFELSIFFILSRVKGSTAAIPEPK
jgi:MFS family permease